LIVAVYKKYNKHNRYVAISNANRHPLLKYAATVYNGVDTSSLTFRTYPDDYLLFFGRIHPHKGTREAIEIALRSKQKIIVAGLIQDAEYFNKYIRPLINNKNVVYAGNCDA